MLNKELLTENGMLIEVSNKIHAHLILTPQWECQNCHSVNYGVGKETIQCWKCNATYPKTALRPDPKVVSAIKSVLHKSNLITGGF